MTALTTTQASIGRTLLAAFLLSATSPAAASDLITAYNIGGQFHAKLALALEDSDSIPAITDPAEACANLRLTLLNGHVEEASYSLMMAESTEPASQRYSAKLQGAALVKDPNPALACDFVLSHPQERHEGLALTGAEGNLNLAVDWDANGQSWFFQLAPDSKQLLPQAQPEPDRVSFEVDKDGNKRAKVGWTVPSEISFVSIDGSQVVTIPVPPSLFVHVYVIRLTDPNLQLQARRITDDPNLEEIYPCKPVSGFIECYTDHTYAQLVDPLLWYLDPDLNLEMSGVSIGSARMSGASVSLTSGKFIVSVISDILDGSPSEYAFTAALALGPTSPLVQDLSLFGSDGAVGVAVNYVQDKTSYIAKSLFGQIPSARGICLSSLSITSCKRDEEGASTVSLAEAITGNKGACGMVGSGHVRPLFTLLFFFLPFLIVLRSKARESMERSHRNA